MSFVKIQYAGNPSFSSLSPPHFFPYSMPKKSAQILEGDSGFGFRDVNHLDKEVSEGDGRDDGDAHVALLDNRDSS